MNRLAFSTKIAVIEPQGGINAANAHAFREKSIENIASDATSVLLVDMTQVEFLDSAGLMSLASIYSLAKGLGRRLILCAVAPSIRIIFELTQLDGAFEIFENREAAEAALNVSATSA